MSDTLQVMADFDESKHPRDTSGKFSVSGGEALQTWAAKPPARPAEVTIHPATPKQFASAFAAAFANSEYKNHVTHYTEDQLSQMKLFISSDGKAGVAVHDHGDGRIEGTALFNRGSEPGMGTRLLKHAIEHGGVNYCECYGEVLRAKYEKCGFEVETKSPFNPEYAAPDWDYNKFPAATTPYYTMRLKKGAS